MLHDNIENQTITIENRQEIVEVFGEDFYSKYCNWMESRYNEGIKDTTFLTFFEGVR